MVVLEGKSRVKKRRNLLGTCAQMFNNRFEICERLLTQGTVSSLK